jgi:zinc protease
MFRRPYAWIFGALISLTCFTNYAPFRIAIPYEQYQLPNGLNVILSPDKGPGVAISVWQKVGSNDEVKGRSGLAHLFEHLMFEGSEHVPSDPFALLESVGAHSLNASTSFERTNYYETVPSDQLELALAVESDRMSFLKISQEKLNEQLEVVRREREQRFEAAPYGEASLLFWEQMFPKPHPFHGHIIGSHEDLISATLADVQNFYKKHYGPTNASIALVGDFKVDEAKALIAKYFQTLPATPKTPEPHIPAVVFKDQTILRVEEKLGKLPLLRIAYITPALYQEGDADLDLLGGILSGSENGRLTKALTRDNKLASSVNTYQQSHKELSVFTIEALLNADTKPEDAINVIDKVLASVANNPITAIEIERSRNTFLTAMMLGLQEKGGYKGKAEVLQSYWRFTGDPGFLSKDLERYANVTPGSMTQSVAKYLPPKDKRKILIAAPVTTQIASKE